jgi:glutamate 5-kinase
MRTKLAAARIASGFGCATIIASGQVDHPLQGLAAGAARATVVGAAGSPAGAYKAWIAGTLTPAGALLIDDGAARALADGKSLLPAGVREIRGSFERGACLSVLGADGRELARGITAYGSADAGAIKGARRGEAAERLGYSGPTAIIHRNDLVLM